MSKTINRAVSVTELLSRRFRSLPFDGPFLDSFGTPELTGSWIIWGPPKNGKTRLVLQVCKYMTRFGRVAFNSLEEGASLSMQLAWEQEKMSEVKGKIILLDKEPMDELDKRLAKRKSPQIVVIDSVQYTGMTYADYRDLRDKYRQKLFILISHAEGREPYGRVAKSIRHDAFVAIHVQGFRAFPQSRYGGGAHYDIWPEQAKAIWDTNE